MAFYYVKLGGTAVGDAGRFGAEQVGGFASLGVSAYYNSIYDVFGGGVPTTPPDGDNILVSDLHEEEHAGVVLGVESATNYQAVNIVSVSDADFSVESKGATVTCTSGDMEIGSNTNFKSGYMVKGVIFNCAFGKFSTKNAYALANFWDCEVNGGSVTDLKMPKTMARDTKITGKVFTYSSHLKVIGGSVSLSWVFAGNNDVGLLFVGTDMTGGNSSKFSHGCQATLINCAISTFPPTKYAAFRPTDSVKYIGCDTSNGYYNYAALLFNGEAYLTTSAHLNYSYDGTNKGAIVINSNSHALPASPIKHKLCEIPAENLSIADKTYRVNLLLDTDTVAALSDTEFWVDIVHNDNASLALGKPVTSRNTNILATGAELTASTEVWQGTPPTNAKAYQVDITLSSASLPNVTNSNIVIYVNLAVPNTDIYICPAVQIGT